MLDNFIFIGLPYGALALFLFVLPYRYFSNRLTWTPFRASSWSGRPFTGEPWHGTSASSRFSLPI